jgi:hypothetical protein
LKDFTARLYFTEAYSANSSSTRERNIDSMEASKFLDAFEVFSEKASEFFSSGIFYDNGDAH